MLRRGEVPVDDDEIRVVLVDVIFDLVDFARPNVGGGIGGRTRLHHLGDHYGGCGVCQACEFVKIRLLTVLRARETHQDSPFGPWEALSP